MERNWRERGTGMREAGKFEEGNLSRPSKVSERASLDQWTAQPQDSCTQLIEQI